MEGILKKLNKVQTELKAPKSQYNKFGGYNYRNCEDILEAVKPILKEVGAIIVLSDDIVPVGDRYYIKATAKFIDIDNAETVENQALAREEEIKKGMDGSQITGAASSYARKYALNGLLAIDDTKDADTLNKGANPMTSEQVKKFTELQVNVENVLKKFKLKDVSELTYEQAEFVIKAKEKAVKGE